MSSVETLIEPLRHSPQLVEAVALLSRQIEEGRTRRLREAENFAARRAWM